MQWGDHRHGPLQRIGVMRRDHPAGKRDISKIIPVSIKGWVRRVGRAGERELVSAGARTPLLAR